MFRVSSYQAVFRILLVSFGLLVCGAFAQDQPDQKASDKPAQDTAGSTQAQPADAVDPLKRPANDKQRKKNQKALKQELSKPYKKWLDEDVVYIITDEERAAFRQLSNDEERDNFIEAFWQRRDPTPDTEENEYKEEHYQRIAYANEHFAAGVPGWRTDRGRMYIVFGKPDEIESHPAGGRRRADFDFPL
jgi:GWxTD domain-containing protein